MREIFSLLVDGRAFSLQAKGGVSQIWAKIFSSKCFKENVKLHLALYPGHEKNIHLQSSGLLEDDSVKKTKLSIHPSDNFNYREQEHNQKRKNEVSRDFNGEFPDAVLNTYYGENILPECQRYIVVVHDFAHEDLPILAKKATTADVIKRKVKAMEAASDLVYISGFTKNRAEFLYPVLRDRQSVVIYHGHDRITPPDRRDLFQFVYVGTRGGYKNFEVVLNAMQQLLTAHPKLKFVVVGGEPSDKILQSVILEFPERIIFESDVSDERVIEHIASSNGYISASEYEGFGIPVLTSMAAGTFTILSDIPPYRELAGHFGSFFVPDQSDSLKALILECMSASDRKRPFACRPWERVAKEYVELLKGHGSHV